MTRSLRSALGALLVAFLALCGTASAATLTIVHVNDSHSHLDAVGPKDASLDGTLGGLEKAATVVGGIRAAEPASLVLHAGDFFEGDIYFNATFGSAELALLAQLGFDAVTVGNHELHYGADGLLWALSGAGFQAPPLLSANLVLSKLAPEVASRVQASMVKTVGGVAVGIFGLTTPYDAAMPDPSLVLGGAAIFEAAVDQTRALRNAGAQVVVLLSHLGFALDQQVAAAVAAALAPEGLAGIDVVVGGHDHIELPAPFEVARPDGGTTLIVQAGESYLKVGRLRLAVDGGTVSLADYALVPVDATVPRNAAVKSAVDEIEAQIVARYGDMFHTPVTLAPRDLSQKFDPDRPRRDTAIGDLVTDALRHETGAEIGVTTLGLLADRIWAGPVVPRDLFRPVAYGFDPSTGLDFQIGTFQITGFQLGAAVEYGIDLWLTQHSEDMFPQVSGMTIAYDSRRPFGSRIVAALVGTKPLDPEGVYTCAGNYALVIGLKQLLEDFGMPLPAEPVILPIDEYEVVLSYAQQRKTLLPAPQPRIVDIAGGQP